MWSEDRALDVQLKVERMLELRSVNAAQIDENSYYL